VGLQGSKTPRFTRGFVVFLALAVCKLGVEGVSSSMDAVQPKIMLMILQQVWDRVVRSSSSRSLPAASSWMATGHDGLHRNVLFFSGVWQPYPAGRNFMAAAAAAAWRRLCLQSL
jgi:hypothetical protein